MPTKRVTIYENKELGLKAEGDLAFPDKASRCVATEWSFGCHGMAVNNVMAPKPRQLWSWEYYGLTVETYFNRNRMYATGDFAAHFKDSHALYLAISDWYVKNPARNSSSEYLTQCLDASIECYKGYSMVVFAPVMNYCKASRGGDDSTEPQNSGYVTWALIKRIAERKVGHLCGSPVTVNKVHNGPAGSPNLSYVQGFVWIPNPGRSIIMNTTFSRMLDKTLKLVSEKDEAAARGGEEGKLFQNIKEILEKED